MTAAAINKYIERYNMNGKHKIEKKREVDINKTEKYKKGEISKIILAALGIGVVLGGSALISPNFPILIGSLLKLIEEVKGVKLSKVKIKRTLKILEKKQIIDLEIKGNEIYVKVRDNWNIDIVKYSIKELLELKRKKDWPGKWFLVIFDVPEEQRNKREYLRKLLKEIGFYQYQQSVYVFPYECEKEINLIKKIIEGGRYLSYIIAEKIEYEDKLKTYFNIST